MIRCAVHLPFDLEGVTDTELVRLGASSECDQLTQALAERLSRALRKLQEIPQPSRIGRPKGRTKWTVDETTWTRTRRKTHRQMALALLPAPGNQLSNYELTRRLAADAGTNINTAGNVIRQLVRDEVFVAEGTGKKRVIKRVSR